MLATDITKKVSDEDLVSLYLETQNVAYFNIIYKRYAGKIFGKCLSLLKSESEAEDATQDIMMKILMNMAKFSGKSRFSTWIYSITYNYSIDYLRRKKKDPSVYIEDYLENVDVEDEVSDSFMLEVSVARLKKILNDIPSGDRTILLMKYQDEMSIKEIGGILNKSESAIKMKIKRAKQKFRKTYKENYKEEY